MAMRGRAWFVCGILLCFVGWQCAGDEAPTAPKVADNGTEQPGTMPAHEGQLQHGIGMSYRKVYEQTRQRLKQQSIRSLLSDVVASRKYDKEPLP